MQPLLPPDDLEALRRFRATLSEPRFARYLASAGGSPELAVLLYRWNTELSKSLYGSLQMWEVALRNRLNAFLCWRYHADWPFDDVRCLRQMTRADYGKVKAATQRQRKRRKLVSIPTDVVVAELSASFWVSLLSRSYDTPFVWRNNLARIFPGAPGITRAAAHQSCARQLELRNRIAHHEPIHHLPLEELRRDLFALIDAMCPVAHAYVDTACTFNAVRADKPALIVKGGAGSGAG